MPTGTCSGTGAAAVNAGDTVICLGDVAHPDAWRDDRLVLDLAESPGERLLVLGNHDRDVPALRRAGFHKTCRTALCASDPPLVLTHIPPLKVPAGAVNVHGHLHRAAGPTDRHVNVAVEHTDYTPVGGELNPCEFQVEGSGHRRRCLRRHGIGRDVQLGRAAPGVLRGGRHGLSRQATSRRRAASCYRSRTLWRRRACRRRTPGFSTFCGTSVSATARGGHRGADAGRGGRPGPRQPVAAPRGAGGRCAGHRGRGRGAAIPGPASRWRRAPSTSST